MRLLTAIFTRKQNFTYFENCLKYWQFSKTKLLSVLTAEMIDLLVIDFSQERDLFEYPADLTQKYGGRYRARPNAGFGNNFNVMRENAILGGYDYVCLLNDDTAIHKDFLKNGIEFLEKNPEVGFVGGEEKASGWLTPIDKMEIPEPSSNNIYEIKDFRRLWWEFSAFIMRVEVLKRVGKFEEEFGVTGYIGDNEYLLRVKQIGWQVYHNSMMPFAHGRGITQHKYRIPTKNGPDPIRDKAIDLMKRKWGVDLNSDGSVLALKYETPYNKGKINE
jgi:cellulose synthase/poly-beta-1,6-N-acetylglucosamine synthase-like glycosyltransferase